MIFTLEALQALAGDSLIVHFGSAKKPRRFVIDGGPNTVYKTSLKPRLDQLKKKFAPKSALPIDMVMVSHVDDDHINGVLALFDDLVGQKADGKPLTYDIDTLWNNAFNDILGDDKDEIRSAIGASVTPASAGDIELKIAPGPLRHERAAVVASVNQGRRLRDDAKKLGIPVNRIPNTKASSDAPGLIIAPTKKNKFLDFGDGLEMMVIGPAEDKVAALQKEWAKAVKKAAKGKKEEVLAAAYSDESVFNLSSIVVVVRCEGKMMLLTGDARGDYILEGLEAAGLKKAKKPVHFDILKMPHHGSNRNMEKSFLDQVTADHYVISANGKHDNPDMDTLQWLAEARGDEDYLVHLTNRDGEKDLGKHLKALVADKKTKVLKDKLQYRDEKALGLKIDLLDEVNF